jgi:hypothetical protein
MVILPNTRVSVLRKAEMEVEAYQETADAGYAVVVHRVRASLIPGGGSSKVAEGAAADGRSGQQVRNYAVLQIDTVPLSYKDRIRDERDGRVWEVQTVAPMVWIATSLGYQRARLRLVEGEAD